MLQATTISLKKNEHNLSSGIETYPDKLRIATETHVHYLAPGDIIRIQSSSCYSKLFFKNGQTLTVSKVLAYFDELLSHCHFLRVHRTHLINLVYLKQFIPGNLPQATLVNDENIPVSRRKKKILLQKMISLSL